MESSREVEILTKWFRKWRQTSKPTVQARVTFALTHTSVMPCKNYDLSKQMGVSSAAKMCGASGQPLNVPEYLLEIVCWRCVCTLHVLQMDCKLETFAISLLLCFRKWVYIIGRH